MTCVFGEPEVVAFTGVVKTAGLSHMWELGPVAEAPLRVEGIS
jgi:hypothetical protein